MRNFFQENKLVLGIIIFAFILRLVSLNQSLWLDEATSALAAKMSFTDLFTKFLPGDFHPPFYYIFMKVWSAIFGYSEIALRVQSVIFGVLSVYLIYLIGKRLFDKNVGLISAALLATSGLHVYYSQEARMYSLAALLVSFLIYLFVEERWLVFALTAVLIAMTDYVSLIIIPVLWLFAIFTKKNKEWWKKFSLSHIPLIVVFLAWLPIFFKQLKAGMGLSVSAPGWWNILGQVSIKNITLIPVKFIFGRISVDNKIAYGIVAALIGVGFLYLLVKAKKQILIWMWLGLSLVIGIALSFFIPTLTYFRYLFVLPAFYLLLASGILNLKKQWFVFGLVFILMVNLVSSFTYLFIPRFWREDWRGLVTFVEGKKTANSVTVFVADSNMEAYYYYAPNAKITGPEGIKKGYDELWLMRYVQDVFDPGDKVRSNVESLGYKNVGEYDFNGIGIWEYKK